MNTYTNYFEKQYKVRYESKIVDQYKNWFFPQWKFIKKKVNITSNSIVLEIGSAYGGFYSLITEVITNKNYEGLELDKKAVSFANSFFHTDSFKNTSLESFKTKKKYDFIFGFELLEHLHDPLTAIEKIDMLLNKEGVFVGTTPFPYVKNIYADPTHLYVLHPENWKKHFLTHGFKTVTLFPMSFTPYLWRIHKVLNIRLPFYTPLPYFISTCLIVARK